MFLPSDITLKPGDGGDYVTELQRRLAQRDLLGQANICGFYDGSTTNAVMEFQSLNGLRSDGIAGPETLRRLISIGSASTEGDSGAATSSSEEEQQAFQRERADMHAMAQAEQAEQEKLANEAVWGYGEEASSAMQTETQQGQQQLSDLDRYQQQHESGQQQQASLQETQQQHAIREELQTQHLDEQQQNAQLEINQQGMKAQTIAQDLEKPIEHQLAAEKEQQPKQQAEQEAPAAKAEHEAQAGKHAMAAQQQEAASEQQPPAPAQPQRDPQLIRTEAQLDAPARQESQQEGQKLDRQGVRDNGTVPETELGDLSPARSPAIERTQEIAR